DLAQDEERAIVQDFDIHTGIDEVILAVSLRNQILGLTDCEATNLYLPNQRKGDQSLIVDVEIARKVLLVEDGDTDLVARTQLVGRRTRQGMPRLQREHARQRCQHQIGEQAAPATRPSHPLNGPLDSECSPVDQNAYFTDPIAKSRS